MKECVGWVAGARRYAPLVLVTLGAREAGLILSKAFAVVYI